MEFVLAAFVKGEALVARVVIGVVSTLNKGRGVATGVATGTGAATTEGTATGVATGTATGIATGARVSSIDLR